LVSAPPQVVPRQRPSRRPAPPAKHTKLGQLHAAAQQLRPMRQSR
jgi:hypothetical protein